MMGGPLGAILGGAIGSSMTREPMPGGRVGSPRGGFGSASGFPGGMPRSAEDMQMVFAVALTSLAAKVAKSDGAVTREEITTFDNFLSTSLGMSAEDRKIASDVFNEAAQSDASTHEFTQQVRMLLGGQPSRMSDIVTILLAIAFADGHYHPAEETLIRQISQELGLGERGYQSCKATFEAGGGRAGGRSSSSKNSSADAYKVLGVSNTATDAEIKSAYRSLAKEYHPDVLQSKGLPDDFMDFAKQKMSAINDAWDVIKRERGL